MWPDHLVLCNRLKSATVFKLTAKLVLANTNKCDIYTHGVCFTRSGFHVFQHTHTHTHFFKVHTQCIHTDLLTPASPTVTSWPLLVGAVTWPQITRVKAKVPFVKSAGCMCVWVWEREWACRSRKLTRESRHFIVCKIRLQEVDVIRTRGGCQERKKKKILQSHQKIQPVLDCRKPRQWNFSSVSDETS